MLSILLAAAQAAAPVAPPPVVPIRPSKIILVGDSTMQVNSGWGGAFCATRVVSTAACVDLGRGGRSTSSYRAEGSWAVALAEARVPGYVATYVLIQFGHNDQPGKPGRSTDLATEFPANLRRYVAEARAAGAVPILVTPLTRRSFTAEQVTRDLDPWADAIRRVAAELRVPLVDLTARSAAVVEAMGPALATHLAETPGDAATQAAALTGTTVEHASPAAVPPSPPVPGTPPRVGAATPVFDYTHLGPFGAELFASVVAGELARAVPAMRPLLIP
ncbi:rhamnogalacturonan acetylesterase [Sphingomonas sp.]|uniref:rhamnogalacturonan acetylesterase n=1 Tax=Sphingomonas sp. TaxID=28214 RepID=UPI003CC565F6